MKRIVLICLTLALCACQGDTPRKPDTAPLPADLIAEATINAKQKQIEDGQSEIARLRSDNGTASTTLAEVKAKLAKNAEIAKALAQSNADLRAEGERIVVESRQAKLHWLSGILGLAALGLGVAAWFSPFFRSTLIQAAAACAAFATLLLFVARWAAYFETIGAVLLLATIGVVIYLWREKAHAIQVLATHFSSYADKLAAIDPQAKAMMDRISLQAQAATPKIKAVIDTALSGVKAKL